MKKNIIKILKSKMMLNKDIINMTIEERNEEIDQICEELKKIPNDIDSDLLKEVIEVAEIIYYEAKASKVSKDRLIKIENIVDIKTKALKEREIKEGEKDELDKLFEDMDQKLDELLKIENSEKCEIKNKSKFVWEEGDIKIISDYCDICEYRDSKNKERCMKYSDGKPKRKPYTLCPNFKDKEAIDFDK